MTRCNCEKIKDDSDERCVSSLNDIIDDMSCNIRTMFLVEKKGIIESVKCSAFDTITEWVKCKANEKFGSYFPQNETNYQ